MSEGAYFRVTEKLDWADHHIKRLNELADGFRNTTSDAVVHDQNAETGEVVYKIAYVPEIPSGFPYVFADVLQNLSSTLDYLACELVTANGKEPGPDTTFPIADSPQGYWERLAPKVKGMGQQAIEEINRHRPYKGGFGNDIWTLNKLNNIAKHRRLLTMASTQVGRSLTPREEGQFGTDGARINVWKRSVDTSKLMMIVRPGRGATIANAGQVLLTVPPSEAQQDMRFIFDIAVNEPDIESGSIVVLLVGMIRSQVHQIVDNLAPLLPK